MLDENTILMVRSPIEQFTTFGYNKSRTLIVRVKMLVCPTGQTSYHQL